MIIKKSKKFGCDYTTHDGKLIGEKYAKWKSVKGMVGFYEFPTLKLFAWLFIPEYSQGDFQNIRSPQNYESLTAAQQDFDAIS